MKKTCLFIEREVKMYITKKNIVLILIAVLCVISAFAIYGLDKYNAANERADYWYEKYSAEKHDRDKEMIDLSDIVYYAVKNANVYDDGFRSDVFEDREFCAKDKYCAVWVSGDSVRIFK